MALINADFCGLGSSVRGLFNWSWAGRDPTALDADANGLEDLSAAGFTALDDLSAAGFTALDVLRLEVAEVGLATGCDWEGGSNWPLGEGTGSGVGVGVLLVGG